MTPDTDDSAAVLDKGSSETGLEPGGSDEDPEQLERGYNKHRSRSGDHLRNRRPESKRLLRIKALGDENLAF